MKLKKFSVSFSLQLYRSKPTCARVSTSYMVALTQIAIAIAIATANRPCFSAHKCVCDIINLMSMSWQALATGLEGSPGLSSLCAKRKPNDRTSQLEAR